MFAVGRSESTKSYDRSGRKGWKNWRKERPIVLMQSTNRATNSQLAICGSTLCSFLYIFSSGRSQPGRFSFGDFRIDFRPSSFEHGALLLGARVKGSRYRSSRSKFSKPHIKRRIELYDRWRERQGRKMRVKRKRRKTGERKWGREPMRGSIRLYSKGGIHHRRRRDRHVCGIRWWSYSVLPPSGSDVTSRCNKHEYKWFLRPVPTVTRANLIESRRNRKLKVNGNKASSTLPNK